MEMGFQGEFTLNINVLLRVNQITFLIFAEQLNRNKHQEIGKSL